MSDGRPVTAPTSSLRDAARQAEARLSFARTALRTGRVRQALEAMSQAVDLMRSSRQ